MANVVEQQNNVTTSVLRHTSPQRQATEVATTPGATNFEKHRTASKHATSMYRAHYLAAATSCVLQAALGLSAPAADYAGWLNNLP
jgi:hypothetical protein